MMGGNFGGAGAMDPELVQQILQATQGQQGGGQLSQLVPQLPQLPWSQATQADPGLAPATAAAVGRLTQPQSSGTLLPAEAGGVPSDSAYGRGSQFWQASNQGQPNDAGTAMDAIKTVVGLPFGLLRAGREGLEDIIGHPNSQRRQQQDAYIQAVNALPANQRALLGLPANDQGTLGMSSSAPVATGQPSTLGQNLQDSRQPGFIEWAQNLGRDVRQQKLAQIQAAMQLQYGVGKLGLQSAQIGSANSEIALHRAELEGKTWDTQQHYKYDDLKNMWDVRDKVASAGASNASAGNSASEMRLHDTQNTGAQQENQQKDRYFNDVSLPTGLQNLHQGDALFNQVTLPSGKLAYQEQQDKRQRDNQGFNVWESEQANQDAKVRAEIAKTNQETTTSATGANLNIARTNQITDNAAGVPSGHGLAQLGREDTARRTEYIKATEGIGSPNGAPTMNKVDAARALGFSVTPGAHWWNSDTVNLDSDPVGFRAAQSALSTQAPGSSSQRLPFLPMPGQGGSNEDNRPPIARGSGTDTNRIYNMLKGSMTGASEAETLQQAQQLAAALPALDMTSKGAFARSTKAANIPVAVARAYWANVQGK